MAHVIAFDTLACMRELETAGCPTAQAEAQVRVLTTVIQSVEDFRRKELEATQGDVLRLEKEIELVKVELCKDIETAKVETIKWVVATSMATGMILLTGMATINRFFPATVQVYYPSHAQKTGLPIPSVPLPETQQPH
ncbi:MAG: CCDC90 family protein [Magnetococcus sp. YQC-5]